jgi:hypothetical protein
MGLFTASLAVAILTASPLYAGYARLKSGALVDADDIRDCNANRTKTSCRGLAIELAFSPEGAAFAWKYCQNSGGLGGGVALDRSNITDQGDDFSVKCFGALRRFDELGPTEQALLADHSADIINTAFRLGSVTPDATPANDSDDAKASAFRNGAASRTPVRFT